MRGKLVRKGAHPAIHRIIPASAGQTANASSKNEANADHPRECGANRAQRGRQPGRVGSSPRVRGKRIVGRFGSVGGRIIPASAGQTRLRATFAYPNSDHPRECGANHWYRTLCSPPNGSSPRVRGKLRCRLVFSPTHRIIPASAGQTKMIDVLGISLSDHPRECGANCFLTTLYSRWCGSSPRVRGKP